MFDKIINLALQRRFVVLIGAILLLIAGILISIDLPVDVFPDLTAPTVTIMTEAHGMAAEEVETLVTLPIESAMNGATDVRRVRSSSAAGFSLVWVEFDWGTDIFIARQIVNEKLQTASATLPVGVDQPMLTPISSIMGEIMMVSLGIDESRTERPISMMELRTIADFEIRRRLLAVNGISQVIPIGGEVKQYQILVSPQKLASFGLSLAEVVKAAGECNQNSSGGAYMDAGNEYLIRGVGRVQSIDDIGNSVVALRNGVPVLMHQVAQVKIAPQVKFGDGSVNMKPAVILTIQKQPQANTVELTRRIEAALNEIQRGLPAGVFINQQIFRQSDFIITSIHNVLDALRDGALLVIIVIFLFLWNFRSTFISVLAIPLSLSITMFVFKMFNIAINTMTLGGMAIAIGALVDDAIIDVENVFRRLKESAGKGENLKQRALSVIYEASREIRAPMVNATLIIVVVFLPLFFLSGVEGRLLRPMGYAYITSIFASLLVALTVTPVLSYYLLPRARFMQSERDSWLVERLKKWYKKTLDFTLHHPKMILLAAALGLLITLTIIPFLGRSFLPEFNEGSFTLSLVTLPGTSLEESNRIGVMAEKIILSHPEVRATVRRTGRAELDEHAQSVNGAEMDVRFELNGKSKEQFTQELRNSLAALPGTNVTIGQPLGHRIDHMLSGTRANIAVKIFGGNLNELRTMAQKIKGEMEKVEGAVDVSVEQDVEVPQTKIKFDRAAMARYGLTVGEVAEIIDIAFNGEKVSEIREGQNTFALIVRYDEENRGDLEKIRNALVDLPGGAKIPLRMIAEVSNEKGSNRISRENVQRKIVVQANVADRDLRSVVDDMEKRIRENVPMPQGYFVEFGGQFESEQHATRIISLLTLVSLAVIFLILYLQFAELKPALFILANLPLALIGGVWSVFFSSGIVSIASLVGFITLFGIATRNGILLIAHFKTLEKEPIDFRELVVRGSLERLSPILMTAITAGLALIPLALGSGQPGKEIEAPMAIVILGGLFSSTALNMIVVPSLYFMFGRKK